MRGIFFFVIGVLAGQLVDTDTPQRNNSGVIMLNHVGIAVDDMDESVAFYTEAMGFEQTFSLANAEGQITLMYLKIGENTFLELNPANDYLPAGLTHIGIQVDGMESVRSMYESRGVSSTESRTSGSQAVFSYMSDPQGIPIELSEYPPDSDLGRLLAGD